MPAEPASRDAKSAFRTTSGTPTPRETEDLRRAAARVTCPVTMLFGADDPRPWTASDSLPGDFA